MGEAIISRGYSGGGSSGGGNQNQASNGMITEIFTSNTLWKAPENLRNGQVHVRLFGGGSAGISGSGGYGAGCGGCMNNGIIDIDPSDREIYITIGSGGIVSSNKIVGESSFFGTYLSANGGSTRSGGSGGGGSHNFSGSSGIQFGGGGGSGNSGMYASSGGNGGIWGGGGGSKLYNYNTRYMYGIGGYISGTAYAGNLVVSGNGGNGGRYVASGTGNASAINGINTIGMDLEFTGPGNYYKGSTDPTGLLSGGGGYGGIGGGGYMDQYFGGGGGGGYGGNGGNGNNCAGGGGGGYGADGGNALYFCGGGGGGYGKYGHGGEGTVAGGIAAGGSVQSSGGSGICILQYWLD